MQSADGMREDEKDPSWKQTADRPYDPCITQEGRGQAIMVGELLCAQEREEGRIRQIVCSPFLRCIQTASEVGLDT